MAAAWILFENEFLGLPYSNIKGKWKKVSGSPIYYFSGDAHMLVYVDAKTQTWRHTSWYYPEELIVGVDALLKKGTPFEKAVPDKLFEMTKEVPVAAPVKAAPVSGPLPL